jgi:hypothetical protein
VLDALGDSSGTSDIWRGIRSGRTRPGFIDVRGVGGAVDVADGGPEEVPSWEVNTLPIPGCAEYGFRSRSIGLETTGS